MVVRFTKRLHQPQLVNVTLSLTNAIPWDITYHTEDEFIFDVLNSVNTENEQSGIVGDTRLLSNIAAFEQSLNDRLSKLSELERDSSDKISHLNEKVRGIVEQLQTIETLKPTVEMFNSIREQDMTLSALSQYLSTIESADIFKSFFQNEIESLREKINVLQTFMESSTAERQLIDTKLEDVEVKMQAMGNLLYLIHNLFINSDVVRSNEAIEREFKDLLDNISSDFIENFPSDTSTLENNWKDLSMYFQSLVYDTQFSFQTLVEKWQQLKEQGAYTKTLTRWELKFNDLNVFLVQAKTYFNFMSDKIIEEDTYLLDFLNQMGLLFDGITLYLNDTTSFLNIQLLDKVSKAFDSFIADEYVSEDEGEDMEITQQQPEVEEEMERNELEQTLEDTRKECSSFENELKSERARLEVLEKQVDHYRAEAYNLRESLERYENEMTTKNEELYKVKVEREELSKSLQSLRANNEEFKIGKDNEISLLQHKISTLNDKAAELQSTIDKMEEESKELRRIISDKTAELEATIQKYEESENKMLEKQQEIASASTALDKARSDLKDLENEKNKYQRLNKEYVNTIRSLENDILKITSERDKLVKDSENTFADQNKTKAALERDISNLQQKIYALEISERDLQVKYNLLKNEKEEARQLYERRLEDLSIVRSNLEQEKKVLGEHIKRLEKNADEKKDDLLKLSKNYNDLIITSSKDKEKHKECVSKIQQLQQTIADLEQTISEIQSRYDEKVEELTKSENEVSELTLAANETGECLKREKTEVEKWKKEAASLQNQRELAVQNRDRIKSELEVLKRRIEESVAEKGRLREENANVSGSISDYEQITQSLILLNNELEEKLLLQTSRDEKEKTAIDKRIQQLQNEINQKNKELLQSSKDYNDLVSAREKDKQKHKEYASKTKRLESMRAESEKTIADMRSEYEQKVQELAESQNKMSELTTSLNEMKTKYEQQVYRAEQANKESATSKVQLELARKNQEKIKTELQALKRTLNASIEERAKLKGENENLINSKSDCEQINQSLIIMNNQLEEKNKSLQGLQSDVEQKVGIIESLTRQVQQSTAQIESIRAQKVNVEKDMEELREAFTTKQSELRNELEKQQERYNKLMELYDSDRSKYAARLEEIERASESVGSELKEKRKELENVKKSVEAQSKVNFQALSTLRARLREKNTQLNEAQQKEKENKKNILSLRSDISRKNDDIQKLRSEIDDLKQSVATEKKECTRHASRAAELEQEINRLKSTQTSMQKDHSSIVEELTGSKATLKDQISRLEQESAKKDMELKNKQVEFDLLEANFEEELNEKKKRIGELIREGEQYRTTIEKLKQDYSKMNSEYLEQIERAKLETQQAIGILQEQLLEKNKELEQKQAQLENLRREKNREIVAKDKELEDLKATRREIEEASGKGIKAREEELQALKKKLKDAEETSDRGIKAKEDELQGLKKKLKDIQETSDRGIKAREEELQSLKKKLKDLEEASDREMEAKDKELKSHRVRQQNLESEINRLENEIKVLKQDSTSDKNKPESSKTVCDENVSRSVLRNISQTQQKLQQFTDDARKKILDIKGPGSVHKVKKEVTVLIDGVENMVETLALKIQDLLQTLDNDASFEYLEAIFQFRKILNLKDFEYKIDSYLNFVKQNANNVDWKKKLISLMLENLQDNDPMIGVELSDDDKINAFMNYIEEFKRLMTELKSVRNVSCDGKSVDTSAVLHNIKSFSEVYFNTIVCSLNALHEHFLEFQKQNENFKQSNYTLEPSYVLVDTNNPLEKIPFPSSVRNVIERRKRKSRDNEESKTIGEETKRTLRSAKRRVLNQSNVTTQDVADDEGEQIQMEDPVAASGEEMQTGKSVEADEDEMQTEKPVETGEDEMETKDESIMLKQIGKNTKKQIPKVKMLTEKQGVKRTGKTLSEKQVEKYKVKIPAKKPVMKAKQK